MLGLPSAIMLHDHIIISSLSLYICSAKFALFKYGIHSHTGSMNDMQELSNFIKSYASKLTYAQVTSIGILTTTVPLP